MDRYLLGTYFDLLCRKVDGFNTPNPARYTSVLWHLHTTQFHSALKMDENRIRDAIYFRDANGIEMPDSAVCIFEMMVALACRIEMDVMSGTADRDRTAEWFWEMMESLGLIDMTDDVYDPEIVSAILNRFMRRIYARNGRGGLFTVLDSSVDMRNQEIWYQAALHLNELLREEGVLDPC